MDFDELQTAGEKPTDPAPPPDVLEILRDMKDRLAAAGRRTTIVAEQVKSIGLTLGQLAEELEELTRTVENGR